PARRSFEAPIGRATRHAKFAQRTPRVLVHLSIAVQPAAATLTRVPLPPPTAGVYLRAPDCVPRRVLPPIGPFFAPGCPVFQPLVVHDPPAARTFQPTRARA